MAVYKKGFYFGEFLGTNNSEVKGLVRTVETIIFN